MRLPRRTGKPLGGLISCRTSLLLCPDGIMSLGGIWGGLRHRCLWLSDMVTGDQIVTLFLELLNKVGSEWMT
jgi:hypothetical protein